EHETKRAGLDALAEILDAKKAALLEIQEQQRQQQTELAETRKATQAAKGRMASLEALQHAALGQEKSGALEWLKSQGLADLPRLGEVLTVEPGWETAVETVLGHLLEAVVHDDAGSVREAVARLAQGRVALVDGATGGIDVPASSLAAKVQGPRAIRALLAPIHAVEALASGEADGRRAALHAGEAIIDRTGVWEGPGWLRFNKSGEAQQGALAREREINELKQQIVALAAREQALVEGQHAHRDALLVAEQAREDAQRTLYLAHRSVSEMGGQLQSQKGRLETAQARMATLDRELAQIATSMESAQVEVREARGRLEIATERMGDLEAQRMTLENERRIFTEQRETARMSAREARESAHQLALALEAQRTRVNALNQSLSRLRGQQAQLASRRDELAAQLQDGDSPIHTLDGERQLLLEQRVIAEKDLATARANLDGIEQELRGYEHKRQQRDQAAIAQRERIAQRRMDAQALEIKAQQQVEAIATAGLELEAVVAGLPEKADAATWSRSIGELEGKMRRLEPVNLAAIQEFAEQSERKAYLDTQNADLVAALEQLEDAIRKIDRETRGRFKETFDRVNAGVQELFPRLFGGGHAYLELTGEDLLDTGVAIMARPPGKRVSNITLLSGGEKALTAVSLVFAIFRLNPAPFCLLDEVDAPLDEANVGRFCTMVSEMSEKVQFLFVSHNKATMEAARQLAGVTMREPGVSRLVSVDLAEATRLAGAA
ncbi:MAG: chromosome segregation protein SMC, partial [Lysobacteraceae bacterium]